MEASIGVTKDTKRTFESVKPPWMSWSDLLDAMFMASDKERLQDLIDVAFEEAEQDAVEHAKARYYKYRKNPQSLLSAGELKQRIRARKLKEQVHLLSRLMAEQPDEQWLSDPRIELLIANTDQGFHALLPTMRRLQQTEPDTEA